jgi:arabinogalactan endo-1,4-beta-galactosidase
MKNLRASLRLSALAIGALCLSCTPEPPVDPASSGGSPGSGGQPASGGTVVATGGTAPSTGGSASGGKASGGAAPSSGGSASGGTPSGGKATGGTATGGTATGGTATGGSASGGKASGGTATGGSSNSGPAYMPAFIIGADISRTQQSEDSGTKFKDVDGSTPSGTTSTGGGILTILKNHGFNYIRLRIFVNPAASGGYSSQGYCDLAHTIKFATGVKQAGMGLLLDFHYSDTWADPGNQKKPAAWANLSFADLTTQVYNYTKDVITQLKANNGRPDMVQVGNEIPQGLLFDGSGAVAGNGGKVSGQQFGNLGALLKAGISGVKDVDSNIKIMMHLDRCNDLAVNTWWLEGVWSQGVQFDILGESCYDRANYQQPASAWPGVFSSLIANGTGSNQYAANYAKLLFVAAEYSDSKQLVNDTFYNIANKRGLGTFVWEPTNWGEMAFNSSGQALSQYMTIYDNIAATYGKR